MLLVDTKRKGSSCRATSISVVDRCTEIFSVIEDTWSHMKKWKELNAEKFNQDQVMKNVCGRMYVFSKDNLSYAFLNKLAIPPPRKGLKFLSL